jgi:hypothetical protein
VEPTGWIGAILASGSSKNAFPIYHCGSFQPAANTQGVGPQVESSTTVNIRN